MRSGTGADANEVSVAVKQPYFVARQRPDLLIGSVRPISVVSARATFPSPQIRRQHRTKQHYGRASAIARCAAKYPHMPWTPTPGGVAAEQRYRPRTGV